MKVKNGFSKLRLFTVIFGVGAVMGLILGILNKNSTALALGILSLLCLFMVKMIRYMYRD